MTFLSVLIFMSLSPNSHLKKNKKQPTYCHRYNSTRQLLALASSGCYSCRHLFKLHSCFGGVKEISHIRSSSFTDTLCPFCCCNNNNNEKNSSDVRRTRSLCFVLCLSFFFKFIFTTYSGIVFLPSTSKPKHTTVNKSAYQTMAIRSQSDMWFIFISAPNKKKTEFQASSQSDAD